MTSFSTDDIFIKFFELKQISLDDEDCQRLVEQYQKAIEIKDEKVFIAIIVQNLVSYSPNNQRE